MGSLKKSSYTIPLPDGATIQNGIATWTSKGKKRTGKLSGENRFFCQSEFWIAKYTDENGKVREVSTKTKNRNAALRFLVKLENEVQQVRAGVLSRKDIDVAHARIASIEKHLADFFIYQEAKGVKERQIKDDKSMFPRLFDEADIKNLPDISRSTLDRWIVAARIEHKRGPRTINSYCPGGTYWPSEPEFA